KPLLRRVAEDLLDLGADIAPASVLAQLGRVDDRRQALDQMAVSLSAGRNLVEELVDSFFGPAAAAPARALHRWVYRAFAGPAGAGSGRRADQPGGGEAAERRVRGKVLLDLLDGGAAAEAGQAADQLEVDQVAGGKRIGVAAPVEAQALHCPGADLASRQKTA